jgi:hypothetical protein
VTPARYRTPARGATRSKPGSGGQRRDHPVASPLQGRDVDREPVDVGDRVLQERVGEREPRRELRGEDGLAEGGRSRIAGGSAM